MAKVPLRVVIAFLRRVDLWGAPTTWSFKDGFVDIHVHIPAWHALSFLEGGKLGGLVPNDESDSGAAAPLT